MISEEIKSKILDLRFVVLDVDGTLTDGGLYYSNTGDRFKKFNVKDGSGIKLLQNAGIEVAFITGLESRMVTDRASDLGIQIVIQNCSKKDVAIEKIMQDKGYHWDEIAFIGDDIIDLGAMQKVGLSVAVADAVKAVKEASDLILETKGGYGAVREFADLVLELIDSKL